MELNAGARQSRALQTGRNAVGVIERSAERGEWRIHPRSGYAKRRRLRGRDQLVTPDVYSPPGTSCTIRGERGRPAGQS